MSGGLFSYTLKIFSVANFGVLLKRLFFRSARQTQTENLTRLLGSVPEALAERQGDSR